MRVFSYSACGTCKRALKWLDKNNIKYDLIDIVVQPPTRDDLVEAKEQLGEIKHLFNTRGKSYRDLGSQVIKAMNESEALEALASDGKLIKRPFLITNEGKILVGFNEDLWQKTCLH